MKLREHAFYIWYFIRTKQVEYYWLEDKEYRSFGPTWTWYDGPIYSLRFWYFNIACTTVRWTREQE